MRFKILLALLVLASSGFASTYLIFEDKPPAFNHNFALELDPIQANVFDYNNVKNTAEKKKAFFDTLRPIVVNQNQKIRDSRQRILFAKENSIDHEWLSSLAEKYKIEWDNGKPDWQSLLVRVDTIPVDLVLTQAANESAWGTSRFAQQANNLFGQWCFSQGCGIIPKQRDGGMKHEVRAFDSINQSVSSYMHNINTTRAYKALRQLRAELREQGEKVSGMQLANGLKSYSSRGQEYVKELQSMIKTNRTLMLDL